MHQPEIQLAFNMPMQLGECPLWHPQESRLYWIDIDGRAVHRLDPQNNMHQAWPMPSEPGAIAWSASGGLLVALRSGLAMLDTNSGALNITNSRCRTSCADGPQSASGLVLSDGRLVAESAWLRELWS